MVERIEPGAFDGVLNSTQDVVMLEGHQRSSVLARRSAGTLRLQDDPRGLRAEFQLPETQLGRDTLENVRNGNIKGLSIGFRVDPGGIDQTLHDGQVVNTIQKVRQLVEISTTPLPAYEGTTLTLTRSQSKGFAAYARSRIARTVLQRG